MEWKIRHCEADYFKRHCLISDYSIIVGHIPKDLKKEQFKELKMFFENEAKKLVPRE